jgi:glycosyltransferase involved in cell wall biosynthesis
MSIESLTSVINVQCHFPAQGVFVNPALVEPFGLTLIEAAAYGLPMVATKNGGPVDIQRVSVSGLVTRCGTSDNVRS